jgi:type II secretory pathway component PulJ
LPNSREEEPYSLMFSSLSHPARRKILRLLAEKPRNFSTILETLGISSSHLTYHLENLGDLLVKLDDGRYKLSPLGDAAVCTMRGVEEPPEAQQKRIKMPLSWKAIFAVLMIGIIISSAVSVAQYMSFNQLSLDYQQMSENYEQLEADYETLDAAYEQLSIENQRLMSWGTSPTTAVEFLRDVVNLDLTKYSSTLESATVEYRDDLGGIVEEISKWALTYESSKVDVYFRFRNSRLYTYSLDVIEGAPYYSELQPTNLIDASKGILERYQQYSGTSHLEPMISMLEAVNTDGNFAQTTGNIKLIRSGTTGTKIEFQYTTNNVDYQAKTVVLTFDEYGFLESLSDSWLLYSIGSTQVNISKEEAIDIAMEYAQNCTWTSNGQTINNFILERDGATAELWPHVRDKALTLIPYWYVTIPLDGIYPEQVTHIGVGLWADTGEFSSCQPK